MNENSGSSQNDFTADEDEIRFDPSKEQEAKTEEKVKEVKKPKKAKWFFLIPLIFLIAISLIFIIWHFIPKTRLNVCLLDKTVLTVEEGNDINIDSVYRKHQGLFWLLEQQRYVFQDDSFYDYKEDYFGTMLDENGKIKSYKNLSSLDYAPDLMYISDVYGAVDDTYGYYDGSTAKNEGITVDDMSVISYAHENGATVVAEMEMFNSGLSDSVYSQLTSLCGVKPTTWVGRYIYDLQDFTDVPDWAPPMYEQQEGVEWQFSGPGILLVSADKIIILEQKTDFESKNLLKIYINEEYKKEFGGCNKVNFYNWFEIVEPNYDSEVIANFEFDVNATGMEKLKGVLSTPRFAAITRNNYSDKAPVYYFAGDFNDYVNHLNYNNFLFANSIYRWISYDRSGDISNFFWNFYNPLMTKILSDIEPADHTDTGVAADGNAARINEDTFQIYSSDAWEDIKLNAVSVNAVEPGKNVYSRNYSFYQQLVEEMVKLGVNCVNAKDILPPEFYRAVYANNSQPDASVIYIIQSVAAPEEGTADAWKSRIESAVDILHGNGTSQKTEKLDEANYFIDVSQYVLALDIKLTSTPEEGYSYSGTYAGGEGTEGFAAYLYDTAQKYAKDNYGYFVPVGIAADASSLKDTGFENENSYSFNNIVTDGECRDHYFFTSVSLDSIRQLISANEEKLADTNDKFAYVFDAISRATAGQTLVTDVGVSSANGMYGAAATTEKSQGQQTVTLLKSVAGADMLGAVVADLNDDWSAVSAEMYPFTVPSERGCMWQNVADPAQTTGVVAMDPVAPKETGINLSDDDRVQMMSLSANEGYFYITANLLTEIDYTTERLFIGIDTYQRNDGEYYYASDYTPTSLSGMEFVIRFSGKQNAGIYAASSYNRSNGAYSTEESYTGSFDLISELTYGSFSSGDNHFYQTGSTVYIRIPWSWLNITDPSQKIVLNNNGELEGQAKTVTTNGALVSVLIADVESKDQLYLFPETKQDPAYKVFEWNTWDSVSYTMREKESFTLLKKYFESSTD